MKEYFFNKTGDQRMEEQNAINWVALIKLIANEALKTDPKGRPALPNKGWDILDIGCHTGGLLKFLDGAGKAASITGVEPIFDVRETAEHRLPKGEFYQEIGQVQNQSADLVVSHEALYLVPDLSEWMRQLKRILRPDGGAFIALGSHSENTAWLRWRRELKKKYSHISYIHEPMNILQTGTEAGFNMELHRLHTGPQTSSRYSPAEDGWGEFISAKEMLDFQQQKYVFVFYPKR